MMRRWGYVAVACALVLVLVAGVGCWQRGQGEIGSKALAGDLTNLSRLALTAPTAAATNEPALVINNLGLGRGIEIQDGGGTPVWAVNDGGSVSQSGDQAVTGDLSITGELQVAQATAAATATPAVIINSLAAGSKLLEVRDAATPVFSILNGGAVSRTGNDTMTGDLAITGAGRVAAATAVATATPAFVVDSLGVSNLLEVRDAATPVFTVNNGGAVVGNVLQYGSSGEKAVAATASFTTTGTVAHGLTTVTWAVCTLAQDADDDAGDTATISVSIAGNTVTVKGWQDDATASTDTDVDVNCLVIGTP